MLLAKKEVDRVDINLYGDSEIQSYSDNLLERFFNKIDYINSIFYFGEEIKLDVYVFLNADECNQYLNEHDKEWTVESYKKAAYSDNSIVILCDKEKLINQPFHYANVFAHMYFHFLYKLIKNNDRETLWYEEGLAQFFSGEKNRLKKDEVFKNILDEKVFNPDLEIPKIEYLFEHGYEYGKFDSDKYDGYAISYMLVRYLRDRLLKETFDYYVRVWDSEDIKRVSKDIISYAYNYYGAWLGIPSYKLPLPSINDPNDLIYYMRSNITYGWIDIYGKRHEHTQEGFRSIYKINSLEQVIESGLATCIEQAMLEHYILKSMNIENKLYVSRKYEQNEGTGRVRLHCFCLFYVFPFWYYFDHPCKNSKKIHRFHNEYEFYDYVYSNMDNDRCLTEIPEIPVGLTISEFNQYINNFEILGQDKKL